MAAHFDYAIAFHYRFTRKGESAVCADLIGTIHAGDWYIQRLSPPIEEAALKAKKIAFESFKEVSAACAKDANALIEPQYQALHKEKFDASKVVKYPVPPLYEDGLPEVWPYLGTESLILEICGVKDRHDERCVSLENEQQTAEGDCALKMTEGTIIEQIKQGLYSLEEFQVVRFEALIAHRIGDPSGIIRFQEWSKIRQPAGWHYLEERRNPIFQARTIELIEGATPDNRVLIAFGSSHLFGECGILNSLKQSLGDKYSIERVVL